MSFATYISSKMSHIQVHFKIKTQQKIVLDQEPSKILSRIKQVFFFLKKVTAMLQKLNFLEQRT